MRVGYNPKKGRIKTDAGVTIDRAFLAHITIEAPAASDADGILPLTNLGVEAQTITTGITNPAAPRNVQIDGNVSGIDGTVTITGTNYAGEAISEEITANGTTAVAGSLAFRTITKIDLPAQDHTPAAQTETIEVTGAPSSDGDIAVAVTAAALGDDSPASVVVSLVALTHDDVTKTAAAIVAAINADATVSAAFTASNEAGVITLTANTPAANDATLEIAMTDTDTTGTTVGSSTNGTAGVPYDQISVGWDNKFGLPYMLPYSTLILAKLGGSADTGTITADADELEKNVFAVNGTPDGEKDIDLYLIV